MVAYFHCFNLFMWKGDTLYVVGSFFFFSTTKEKHLSFPKYPDTCNRGLKVLSRTVDSTVGGNCVGSPTSTSLDAIYWRGMSKSSSVVWHAWQWDIYNKVIFKKLLPELASISTALSVNSEKRRVQPSVRGRSTCSYFPNSGWYSSLRQNPLGKNTPEM